MTPDELQARTKAFALRVIKLVAALPGTVLGRTMGAQLLRAATSVGANYRAARRARSKREFIAKICIVVEEADESAYWLDLIADGGLIPKPRIQPLYNEAMELTRIFAAARQTATGR